MYPLSYEPSAMSPQPNQGYSPLNHINLDMENLFNTQDYYAGQGSGGNREYYTGHDYSMGHGSALVEENSPIKEVVAPVKAKKRNENGSCDLTVYQKACAKYAAKYDHNFTLEPCWAILRDHFAWKQVEIPLIYSNQNQGRKKAKTSETISSSAQGGLNLNEEANGSGEEKEVVLTTWPCPFRGFHCCPDGEVGNKGIARLISHLKRLHLSSDERKCVLREAISTDHGLYMTLEETLKVFNQLLCGKCMTLHAVSRACHHPDGLVRFSKEADDMSGYIVGISKPSNKESDIEVREGLALDAELLDHVFKLPITTVKSIPHGCRLAFSQALKTVLYKVVAQPDSVAAWVRLLLFPRCTFQLHGGKDDGITTLVKSMLDGSWLGSLGQGGGDFMEERTTGNTNIKQCLRKVADGHFTAVVKVLSSSGLAPYCDDTIKALEAKHPYKPPPTMPSNTFSEPPLVAEIDCVFGCIKSFPEGTSCGRDGLRAQHILDALCGEGSATATDLLKAITSFVNLWLAGRCPPILAEFVASAPLTPLLKPDNRTRPIAVGTIWRRLVFKVAMKGVGKEMSKYLGDFQFGVGVSGGANRVLSEHHNDGSLAMLTVDFSNAFNLVDRSTLLHEGTHISGLPRGCSKYLDDGTVIGDSEEVSKVLDIIKLHEGLFPVDIRRPSLGVKLLGGAVSRDADFISGLAMRRAANAVDLMSLLLQLNDPQSELLLLRSCMGIAKLFFGLRTCQPVHMDDAALFFDKGLHGSIENIVVCGGPFFGDLQWRLASLPIRLGGLGFDICGMDDDYVSALACLRDTIPSFDFSVFTNKDTAPSKAQQTLASALFSEMVKDMKVHFDMTVRQKAVFECLRAPHAQDFLLAIPIDRLGQHMSPVEYRTILKYRLMIPLFSDDAICPVCRKACLDSFGEHAVHCKELPGFKYRHDMVRDVLFYICRHAGISVKKEAPVNFLTDPSDGRSTLRPVVFGWVGGKHACVDLTGVSPLVGLSSQGFTVGQAALKAASCKVAKHEKACIENQHVFIPFAFDTFGFLAPEAVELLTRVQRVMNSNVMTPRSINVVFNRIGFAIQKGLAA
ncbi:hypothetical protein Tco_1121351 [Tanacetum coccineum]|uniref:Reverse transcriptase domain-containing protein n=1 Tax=Tanacetum coccineum TaxID=301880 RepID=A0ABQ5IXU7_9ASTR